MSSARTRILERKIIPSKRLQVLDIKNVERESLTQRALLIDDCFMGDVIFWDNRRRFNANTLNTPSEIKQEMMRINIDTVQFDDIRNELVLPKDNPTMPASPPGQEDVIRILKVLHCLEYIKLFRGMCISLEQYLRICVKAIVRWDYIDFDMRKMRNTTITDYYQIQWLITYFGAVVGGGSISCVTGMRRSRSDIDLFLPMPVNLEQRFALTVEMYRTWFSKLVQCAFMKFVTRSFDVDIIPSQISLWELYKLAMLAVFKTSPVSVLNTMVELFTSLAKYLSPCTYDRNDVSGGSFCDARKPYHLIMRWSGFDLVLVPFLVHPRTSDIPFKKNFLYTIVSGFDFPHAKFVSTEVSCAIEGNFMTCAFGSIYSLCAPKFCHKRLLSLCACVLCKSVADDDDDDNGNFYVENFVKRHHRYYCPYYGTATNRLTFLPSLSNLALCAIIDYGDFSLSGFEHKFNFNLSEYLSSEQLQQLTNIIS